MRHTYALMALLAIASMPATLAQESFLKDEVEASIIDAAHSTGRIPETTGDKIKERVDTTESGTNSGFNGDIETFDLNTLTDEMILCLQEGRRDCEGTPMITGSAEQPSNPGSSTGRLPVDPTGINETIETILLDNSEYLLCVEEGRTDCEGGIENGNRIAVNPMADDLDKDKEDDGSSQSTGRLPVEDQDGGSGFNGDIDALDIDTIDYVLCVQEGRTDCHQIAPPSGGSPDKPYPNRCADGSFGCFSDDEAHETDDDDDESTIIENNIITHIFGGASDGFSTASLASACSLILIVQSSLF